MAEGDISDLLNRLNLQSTQQQYAHTPVSGENTTGTRKSHTRRSRRRRKSQQIADNQIRPQQNHSLTRQNEQGSGGIKRAEALERSPSPKCNSNSGLDDRVRQSIKEESAANHSSLSLIAPSAHVYVVQVMRPSEIVESVYLSSVDANKRALRYLECQYGIKANEISEERGLFGQAISAAKATKRMWRHTDTLEILTRGGVPWIKVLKKPLYSDQIAKKELAYLSLDQTDGLFVIGAYQSQEKAWEHCKKYWSDLAVCSSIADLKDWHDGRFHHAQARVAGKLHHWSLKEYEML
ncbi:hypothetical protein ZTR_10265 [Talaromyces verruculosus]|nr:hypothetical protein ZTR_10265 [Talaromyces verruculosus]